MLRVQRTNSDRAPVVSRHAHQQPQQQQQHVALAPRPLFHGDASSMNGGDASMMIMLPRDDATSDESVSQLRSQHHLQPQPQLHHVHHHHHVSATATQHARLSHSAKARKIKSAGDGASSTHASASTPSSSSPSSGASSGGRKVLKQEVVQLQQLVDGMQQQVDAATREVQELRNMVGLMIDETAAQIQQSQKPLRAPQDHHLQQQPPSCVVTPLMDIYQQSSFALEELSVAQQSDLAEHFGFEASGDEDVQSVFYCKMEQALLCDDDDDFPLFFQS